MADEIRTTHPVIWGHHIYTEPTDIPGVIRCWQVGRPSWLEVDWESPGAIESQNWLKEQR